MPLVIPNFTEADVIQQLYPGAYQSDSGKWRNAEGGILDTSDIDWQTRAEDFQRRSAMEQGYLPLTDSLQSGIASALRAHGIDPMAYYNKVVGPGQEVQIDGKSYWQPNNPAHAMNPQNPIDLGWSASDPWGEAIKMGILATMGGAGMNAFAGGSALSGLSAADAAAMIESGTVGSAGLAMENAALMNSGSFLSGLAKPGLSMALQGAGVPGMFANPLAGGLAGIGGGLSSALEGGFGNAASGAMTYLANQGAGDEGSSMSVGVTPVDEGGSMFDFGDYYKMLNGDVSSGFDSISNLFGDSLGGLQNTFGSGFLDLSNQFGSAFSGLGDTLGQIPQWLSDYSGDFSNSVMQFGSGLADSISSGIGGLGSGIGSAFEGLGSGLSQALSGVGSGIAGLGSGLANMFGGLTSSMGGNNALIGSLLGGLMASQMGKAPPATSTTTSGPQYTPEEQAARSHIFNNAKSLYDSTSSQIAGMDYPGAKPVGPSAPTQDAWSTLLGYADGEGARNSEELKKAQTFGLNGALDVKNNPYLSSAINAAIRPLTEQMMDSGGILSQIRGNSTLNGQPGGTRQGIAEGIALKKYQNAVGDISAKMSSDAYTKGLDTFSKTLAVAPNTQSTIMQPGLIKSGVGTQQEGYQQAQNDYTAGAKQWKLNAPWAPLQNYTNLVYGGSSPSTTTTATANPPQSSSWNNILSGALMGGSLFGGKNTDNSGQMFSFFGR